MGNVQLDLGSNTMLALHLLLGERSKEKQELGKRTSASFILHT